MSKEPEIRCSCCFELVSWSDFPAHLDDHGGEIIVEEILVSGDKPETQAIGEYNTENCVGVVFVSKESQRRRVHLHRDNDATEERRNGIAVECPFCGAWADAHTLQHDGCECGAVVRMELSFEKGE